MSDRKCQCCAAKERAAEDYNVLHTTMTDEIRRMRDAHAAVVDPLRARLAECERERDAFNIGIAQACRQRDDARDDRDQLRLKAARHESERDAARARVAELERERDEARASFMSLRAWAQSVDMDAAIQRAASAEGKLRETTYAALAAREQGESDAVRAIVALIRERAGAANGLSDYQRGRREARLADADDIESGAWRGKEGA